MTISLLVAASENNVIGKNNKLPWNLPTDMKYFKNISWAMPVIMGRKTFDSIGKPLPGRTNVIITRQENFNAQGCIVVKSIEEAIKVSKDDTEIFITGGSQIFDQAFLELLSSLHLIVLLLCDLYI